MKNKLEKILPWIGWILFASTLFVMLWVVKPSRTVDFSGVVKSIEYNEQENCTYITASMILQDNSSVIIKAKDNISVKEITGEKMKLEEIKVGDLIDLDYKGKIDGKDSIVTAKWIKVAKGYASCNEEDIKSNELFEITNEPQPSENIKVETEKDKYSADDNVIKYSITNTSDFEQSIAGDDDCFSLQILVDGEWKRLGTKKEHYWNSLAQILNPSQTVQREIDLDEYFNSPLSKGTYRIAVEELVSNTFEIS